MLNPKLFTVTAFQLKPANTLPRVKLSLPSSRTKKKKAPTFLTIHLLVSDNSDFFKQGNKEYYIKVTIALPLCTLLDILVFRFRKDHLWVILGKTSYRSNSISNSHS